MLVEKTDELKLVKRDNTDITSTENKIKSRKMTRHWEEWGVNSFCAAMEVFHIFVIFFAFISVKKNVKNIGQMT